MAIYTTLDVYKAAYDLLLALYKELKDVPRDTKFTLVQDMKLDVKMIMRLIYRANATKDKGPVIAEAREITENVKVGLRILKDLGHLGMKKYIYFAERAEEVSKQLAGWHKYANREK